MGLRGLICAYAPCRCLAPRSAPILNFQSLLLPRLDYKLVVMRAGGLPTAHPTDDRHILLLFLLPWRERNGLQYLKPPEKIVRPQSSSFTAGQLHFLSHS